RQCQSSCSPAIGPLSQPWASRLPSAMSDTSSISQDAPETVPTGVARQFAQNVSTGSEWKSVVALALLLTAFLLLQFFLPLRTAVQIGGDEGFELAKATLCLHGHSLYTEVWNDQPPLHTFLITQVLKHH